VKNERKAVKYYKPTACMKYLISAQKKYTLAVAENIYYKYPERREISNKSPSSAYRIL